MSTGTRVALPAALDVVEELVARLAPACLRIEPAGSIRRGSPDVGDVELVAIPRTHDEPSGLFFEVDAIVDELAPVIDRLVAGGEYLRLLGKDRYTKLRHRRSGLQVDLFSVRPPAQWGVIFLIRTGPAGYSHRFVTEARDRGHHSAHGALHAGRLGCGALPCEVVETPEEIDVYRALGVPYLAPAERLA